MDWLILTLSLIAGVVGTGLGGIIGALLKNGGGRVMGRVLGFAGGVMMGVVAFEMIPEAIEASVVLGKIGGIAVSVGTTVGGMIVIYLINKLLDFIEYRRKKAQSVSVAASDIVSYKSYAQAKKVRVFSGIGAVNCRKTGGKNKCKKRENASEPVGVSREMLKAGTVMLIAIALHNFPEGMAIGAGGAIGTEMGALIAIIIALHNIPEGMAISAPLVSGGVGGIKAVLLTALAGGATVVGAALGLAVGGLGALATGICLSLASGAMMYVTFCEIFPQSITLNDGEVPSVSMLVGLILSILFVFIL